MKKPLLMSIIAIGIVSMILYTQSAEQKNILQFKSAPELEKWFTLSAEGIAKHATNAIAKARDEIKKLVSVPASERTFSNTAQVFDALKGASDAVTYVLLFQIIEMTHPDAVIRAAAHEAFMQLQSFFIDEVDSSPAVFQAWQEYVTGNAVQESLTETQRYYLEKVSRDFKREGMYLAPDVQTRFKALKKEISKLCSEFETAISQDNRTITVPLKGLKGMDESFIARLKQDEAGNYKVGVDYPTFHPVMERCSVESTRKALWKLFVQRAYPANKERLEKLIASRDTLAQLLGYASYAAYELDDEMVKTPEHAFDFLYSLLEKGITKEAQEMEELMSMEVEGIAYTPEKQLDPWNLAHLKYHYKKKYFDLDEEQVAEYFPMKETIEGLFEIYQQFFSLRFKQLPFQCPWADDITLMAVYDENNKLLGHFILDLYPRDNKYGHACCAAIVHALEHAPDSPSVFLAFVIANFPKPSASKPSLLRYKDVSTFFHEFGHALHGLLGRTAQASLSGTQVKRDFVEMPSQMLEEWLYDPHILKQYSRHYQTGEPLPDHLIQALIKLRTFGSGLFITTQCYYSLCALEYFGPGSTKNVEEIQKKLHQVAEKHILYNVDDKHYANFGHLTEYGARYYGYMWSKVFALDLFEDIKKGGLLDPVTGHRYAQIMLVPGGSKDPSDMLRAFLGREPNQKAFLAALGLESDI